MKVEALIFNISFVGSQALAKALGPAGEGVYITQVSFYNFPYTVGFLLSRALFQRFKQEGAAFLPTYEAFLARSGSSSCEDLARDVLGVDLESTEFWAATISSVGEVGSRFEALLSD